MEITIETTADGSPTLYRADIDEHYHSVKGALTESLHVYLESGWRKEADLLTMKFPEDLDAIYFDAFAPEKQPEMWDETIFRRLYATMRPGAVLTTYCAKGIIRRMLRRIGFLTERLPGPRKEKEKS